MSPSLVVLSTVLLAPSSDVTKLAHYQLALCWVEIGNLARRWLSVYTVYFGVRFCIHPWPCYRKPNYVNPYSSPHFTKLPQHVCSPLLHIDEIYLCCSFVLCRPCSFVFACIYVYSVPECL